MNEIISIVNTDINVDFDTPRDYVEPKKPSPPPPSPKMLSPGMGENKINPNIFVSKAI